MDGSCILAKFEVFVHESDPLTELDLYMNHGAYVDHFGKITSGGDLKGVATVYVRRATGNYDGD